MTALALRTYQVTLKLPGLRTEGAGQKEAVELASRLEAELGAVRITVREIDPVTGDASLPFYAKAVA